MSFPQLLYLPLQALYVDASSLPRSTGRQRDSGESKRGRRDKGDVGRRDVAERQKRRWIEYKGGGTQKAADG
jgi:hypothetical protein